MLSVDSPDVKQGAAKGCGVLKRAESTLEMTQLRVDNSVYYIYVQRQGREREREREVRACNLHVHVPRIDKV